MFLQNYRPGVAARLGLDYESLRAINPDDRLRLNLRIRRGRAIPGSIRDRTSCSRRCPARCCRPGARGEPPTPAGQYLADAVTASTAFEGVLAALLHRERTGEGQLVTVNMLDALTTLQMQELSVFTVGGIPQERGEQPNAHVYIRAPYGIFATSDGYLALGFADLETLGAVIGEPSFAGMVPEVDGWTRRDELYAKTEARLRHEHHAVLARATAGRRASGPARSTATRTWWMIRRSRTTARSSSTTILPRATSRRRVSRTGSPPRPPRVDRGAPLVGEHSREVLTELGSSAPSAFPS